MQEVRIQRDCVDRGIYDTNRRVSGILPKDINPHELFIRLRMLETASRDIAEQVVWHLFWELEAEPSYYEPEKSWLYPYAKNHLKHLHETIAARNQQDVEKVMEL